MKVYIISMLIILALFAGCVEPPVSNIYTIDTWDELVDIPENSTIYVNPGIFNEKVIIDKNNIHLIGKNTTIDGTGLPSYWDGMLRLENVYNVTIEKFNIVNSPYFGIYIVENCTNITIKDLYIDDCESSGIIVYDREGQPRNITIDNNVILDVCRNMNQEALSLSNVDGFLIANNYINGSWKEGIDAKSGCRNGLIRYNFVSNSKDYRPNIYVDAYARDSWNITIEFNECYGTGQGISLATEEGGTLTDIFVYKNQVNVQSNAFSIHRYDTEGSHLKTDIIVSHNYFESQIDGAIQITELPERFVNPVFNNNTLVSEWVNCPIC